MATVESHHPRGEVLAEILSITDYIVEEVTIKDVQRTKENRKWNERRSRRMAESFNLKRAIVAGFVLGLRTFKAEGKPPGTLVWLDGQNRGEAAKMAGLGDERIHAFVIEVNSFKDEADWVLALNDDRVGTPLPEQLRLGRDARRSDVLLADKVCERHGFVLDAQTRAGHIGSIGLVLQTVRRPDGEFILDNALTCAAHIAPTEVGVERPVLAGLVTFWHLHPSADLTRLLQCLARGGTATKYLMRAKDSVLPQATHIYRQCVDRYNGQRDVASDDYLTYRR